MNDNVDILLAVKNGALFLEDLLKSLFRQTYPHFHLIVRDNASTDATPALLQKWSDQHPGKITFISGKEDLGVVGNFSALLTESKAPYVMFCDGDDIWLEDKIAVTLSHIQENEKQSSIETPLLAYTDLTVVDSDLHLLHPSFWTMTHRHGGKPISLANALVENKVTGCTMMINRALALLANPIPLDVPMHDAWISLIATALGKVIAIPQATILYRQHGNNDSGAQEYGWRKLIAKFSDPVQRKKIAHTRCLRMHQAQHFLERFEALLSDEQKELINAYLSLPTASWAEHAALLWKYGLWETGLWRRVYQVFH